MIILITQLLLRKKAAEELKKEQERKAAERRRIIEERCGKPKNIDDANEGKVFLIYWKSGIKTHPKKFRIFLPFKHNFLVPRFLFFLKKQTGNKTPLFFLKKKIYPGSKQNLRILTVAYL